MLFIKLYFSALIAFLVIDLFWLGVLAKNFYKEQLGFLFRTNVNLFAVILFYALFIAGLVFFVIIPSIEKKSLVNAVFMGAFFGLVTYATYDLTNLATVKNWPLTVTIVDLIWGAVLCAVVSAIVFLVSKQFNF